MKDGLAQTPIIDRTTFESKINLDPKAMYAASALASLGIGFVISGTVFARMMGARSRLASTNVALAIGCVGLACALRVRAKPTETVASKTSDALADASTGERIDYSIIIPVYNRPHEMRVLLRALSEICANSEALGTGEILVVDDGSTDDTAAVVREIARTMPIETTIVTKSNGGVSSGRNAGFAHARGRIGIVIDSDCVPETTWLASMLKAVNSDPNVLVFARIRAGKRPVYPLENLPDSKGFVGASYAMMKRSYLAMGGCYERYGASHDDRDLVLTALARGFDVGHASHGWIGHPLRTETLRSMWRVGLNSRFGNLFAMRHGIYAAPDLKPTPYYLLGIGSNYGTSIGFVVVAANIIVGAFIALVTRSERKAMLRIGPPLLAALCGAYAGCLLLLGLITRARPRELPKYVATLASFQLASTIGRIRGTRDYGIFIL